MRSQTLVKTGSLLLFCSALLLTQCTPQSTDVVDGATVLYFYAEW